MEEPQTATAQSARTVYILRSQDKITTTANYGVNHTNHNLEEVLAHDATAPGAAGDAHTTLPKLHADQRAGEGQRACAADEYIDQAHLDRRVIGEAQETRNSKLVSQAAHGRWHVLELITGDEAHLSDGSRGEFLSV